MDSKSNHLAQKRKVTYDDILSSLNMKVVNGKLQIVRNAVAENIKAGNIDPSQLINETPQPNIEETPILTPEQQKEQQKQLMQLKALNYLTAIKKQEEQKRRIQAVKSTKLQFST